jgi:hypothetical protein
MTLLFFIKEKFARKVWLQIRNLREVNFIIPKISVSVNYFFRLFKLDKVLGFVCYQIKNRQVRACNI